MNKFWLEKKVLVTGHTGFKGSWLTLWLQKLGACISGVALPPDNSPNLFKLATVKDFCFSSDFCDIRDFNTFKSLVERARPEIVFHLAAQPLVRRSYREPVATFSTNIMGTAHLLEALRGLSSVRVIVIVTTDKVYHNVEWYLPYRENDQLGGYDPYSASKAACEIVVDSYRNSFFRAHGVAIATARAGNVIGGGDWSEDRLIPDIIRALETKTVLKIRNPQAIRPWQHVLEPLGGYLQLAKKLWYSPECTGAYNFGPKTAEVVTVQEILNLATEIEPSIQAKYADEGLHETDWLSLEIAKARTILGYQPCWNVEVAVKRTMHWYLAQRRGDSAFSLCQADIEDYEKELSISSNFLHC